MKKKYIDRKKYNEKLLKKLSDYLKKYPDARFSQALLNLGIVKDVEVTENTGRGREALNNYWVDEYFLEPDALLERIDNG